MDAMGFMCRRQENLPVDMHHLLSRVRQVGSLFGFPRLDFHHFFWGGIWIIKKSDHMDVSENSGFSPQIIHFNRGFPF